MTSKMSVDQFHYFLDTFKCYPNNDQTETLSLGLPPAAIKKQYELKVFSQKTLFIDVTHTVHYRFNSGIQRVVRSLVAAMKINGAPFELIKFDIDGQPVALNPYEINKFYNWEKYLTKEKTTSDSLDGLIRKLGPLVKLLIPNFLWDQAKRAYRILKYRLNDKSSFSETLKKTVVIDLRKHSLFLPEITTDEAHINSVSVMSKHYGVVISSILYDLIPVTHPEFCSVGYDFIHYLRIFRTIHSVLAISKHSESELIKLMALLPREVSEPLKTKTIYISGDFPSLSRAQALKKPDDKKVILMVARFEPRKNIRRVLAAVQKLFEENIDFKFVIVGNPGWMQENIIADLNALIAKGFDVEFHMRISDSELAAWYQKCYFTVFCSITEGFGLPILESVLMGKPCLTSDFGAQAEIGHLIGGCDFANPTLIDDIYEKMKILLINKDYYKIQVEQTKFTQWPSWSDYAKQIYEYINSQDL
ncbi:MAG: hypothetical protein B7Y39_10180 [Bdellovibrio sp. 28-41-41]|nr:MAG: hypothetical protein B7Y39_10180 [Bdellovibrio sp. 28-41-41]